MSDLTAELKDLLQKYSKSFGEKVYEENDSKDDILMDTFGITSELKKENRQYWGRELGMCWQLLVTKIAKAKCKDFRPAMKVEADEPTDLFIGNDAIDTKYRIGSGDSGTLKKFKKYGQDLKSQGFRPLVLILREDNLPAAITACRAGGWTVLSGQSCLQYITEKTGFDIKKFLQESADQYKINRLK